MNFFRFFCIKNGKNEGFESDKMTQELIGFHHDHEPNGYKDLDTKNRTLKC